MSRHKRKPTICIGKNKDTDQLCSILWRQINSPRWDATFCGAMPNLGLKYSLRSHEKDAGLYELKYFPGKAAGDMEQQKEITNLTEIANSMVTTDQSNSNQIITVMSGNEPAFTAEAIIDELSQTEMDRIDTEEISNSGEPIRISEIGSRMPLMRIMQKVKKSNIGKDAKIVVYQDGLDKKGLKYEIGPIQKKQKTNEEVKIVTEMGQSDNDMEKQDEDKSLNESPESFVTKNGDRVVIVKKRFDSAATQTPVKADTGSGGGVLENMLIQAGLQTVTKTTVDECSSETQETEQFIIVHLPDGVEAKQKEVRKPVNYQQYNEVRECSIDT